MRRSSGGPSSFSGPWARRSLPSERRGGCCHGWSSSASAFNSWQLPSPPAHACGSERSSQHAMRSQAACVVRTQLRLRRRRCRSLLRLRAFSRLRLRVLLLCLLRRASSRLRLRLLRRLRSRLRLLLALRLLRRRLSRLRLLLLRRRRSLRCRLWLLLLLLRRCRPLPARPDCSSERLALLLSPAPTRAALSTPNLPPPSSSAVGAGAAAASANAEGRCLAAGAAPASACVGSSAPAAAPCERCTAAVTEGAASSPTGASRLCGTTSRRPSHSTTHKAEGAGTPPSSPSGAGGPGASTRPRTRAAPSSLATHTLRTTREGARLTQSPVPRVPWQVGTPHLVQAHAWFLVKAAGVAAAWPLPIVGGCAACLVACGAPSSSSSPRPRALHRDPPPPARAERGVARRRRRPTPPPNSSAHCHGPKAHPRSHAGRAAARRAQSRCPPVPRQNTSLPCHVGMLPASPRAHAKAPRTRRRRCGRTAELCLAALTCLLLGSACHCCQSKLPSQGYHATTTPGRRALPVRRLRPPVGRLGRAALLLAVLLVVVVVVAV